MKNDEHPARVCLLRRLQSQAAGFSAGVVSAAPDCAARVQRRDGTVLLQTFAPPVERRPGRAKGVHVGLQSMLFPAFESEQAAFRIGSWP